MGYTSTESRRVRHDIQELVEEWLHTRQQFLVRLLEASSLVFQIYKEYLPIGIACRGPSDMSASELIV